MAGISRHQRKRRLIAAKLNEVNRRRKLLKQLKQENPHFEEVKFVIPQEEGSSGIATGEEYKMEGGDSDDDEEHMEVECKVKIEVDEDTELVHDHHPLDLTDMEGLSTATTSRRSATTVKSARSLEDAKRRNAEKARVYRARKKSEAVGYLLSNSTRVRDIRPRPENCGGEDRVDHEPNVCLLCFNEISSVANTSSANSSFPSGKDADFLVMFVLKKMLEVPSNKLEDYLKRRGNPRNWISFCYQCKVKIDQMMAVQQEINELEKKLRKFQRKIKETITMNFVKNKKTDQDFTRRKSVPLEMTQEIWRGVAKELHPSPRLDYSKRVQAEGTPCSSSSLSSELNIHQSFHHFDNNAFSTQNDSSTGNKTGHFNRRKGKLGVRLCSDNTDDVPTFIGDDDNMHSSVDTNTTTLTVEEWLFDKKWLVKLCFNENGALKDGYSCHLCPKLNGMKLEAFVKHILYHKERPHRCSVCDVFQTGSDLELTKLPKMVHKKEGVPEDHKCSKDTLVPVTFQARNVLECGFCDSETFNSEEERQAHERLVHHETSVPLPYDCSKCSSKFRDYVEWRLHRALQHPDLEKLGCFYCDEMFAKRTKEGADLLDSSARRNHIQERHGPTAKATKVNGFDCDICGENFEIQTRLLEHVEVDHGLDKNKSVGCVICFARFPPKSLMVHYRSGIHFDNVAKEKFICDMCGYENVNQSNFLEHKFMKHDIEPEDNGRLYTCKEDNCSFKCVVKRTLKVHMMKEHNAERDLKCDTCGKGFLTRSHFKDHQRIHSGLKPFQCEICGNSFAVKNYLYIHKRLSHQNRPFASTHKKRAPKRSRGINFQNHQFRTIHGSTHQRTQNNEEINSQIGPQTSPALSEWTTPPPQPLYQTPNTGNHFEGNCFQDHGSSSSTTTQLRN